MKYILPIIFVLALMDTARAQVNDIKAASSTRNSGGSYSGGSGDGGAGASFVGDLVFHLMIGGIINAQQQKLSQREDIPTLVSLDLMVQTAIQPASYYIAAPRIRGNWGLFSTDFRMNYILEEGLDGLEYIRTNDWQILELNLITTQDVLLRVGGGFTQEVFGTRNTYGEWTAGFHYQPLFDKWGGVAEYRAAESRKEVSGFVHCNVFEKGSLHGFVTAGAVYQRHYESITTWGLQGGFLLKVY